MMGLELHEPHHLTADYVGEPGARTFYLQAEDEHQRASFLMEKEQVAALAQALEQLLHQLDESPATDWDRSAMQLRQPLEEQWRVGDIAVGADPESEQFFLELTEFVGEDEREPWQARLWAVADQTRRWAAHAAEAVTQGRPRCRFCGRPEGPDGDHVCPAMNGHGELAR
ncbi:MAG: DUF3090 family protein [Nitriliruptorales bacterium]|nr:DUF3090 family protein [Nitriliruptorales bacterium]